MSPCFTYEAFIFWCRNSTETLFFLIAIFFMLIAFFVTFLFFFKYSLLIGCGGRTWGILPEVFLNEPGALEEKDMQCP